MYTRDIAITYVMHTRIYSSLAPPMSLDTVDSSVRVAAHRLCLHGWSACINDCTLLLESNACANFDIVNVYIYIHMDHLVRSCSFKQ